MSWIELRVDWVQVGLDQNTQHYLFCSVVTEVAFDARWMARSPLNRVLNRSLKTESASCWAREHERRRRSTATSLAASAAGVLQASWALCYSCYDIFVVEVWRLSFASAATWDFLCLLAILSCSRAE